MRTSLTAFLHSARLYHRQNWQEYPQREGDRACCQSQLDKLPADGIDRISLPQLGFTCGNDLTWRRAQQKFPYSGTQWCYGKGIDNFAPIGPVLVSPKLIDTTNLKIQSRLNGQDFQEDRTDNMMHTVADIIAHFSSGTTLEAGDMIMTGTPQGEKTASNVLGSDTDDKFAGVGYAREPPVFLKDGDDIEVQIENIGTLRHSIKFL